tara:strand:+ start:43 stop:1137 length:1095 start_codon:yes stop_codon:yes gene_type:complete
MQPFLGERSANASSLHRLGREARDAVEQAREYVGALMGAGSPENVFFTSGGTESDVWALRGVFEQKSNTERNSLLVSTVEHPAVLDTAAYLSKHGVDVQYIEVDSTGCLYRLPVTKKTRLVSVMAANNETGNLYNLKSMALWAQREGALIHTDAVQALGKIPVNVNQWGVDFCSVSAHKIGGPQGVGALYVHPDTSIGPLITGGGQERGHRSGTLNVAGIVGFGAVAKAIAGKIDERSRRMAALRDRLESQILTALKTVHVLGDLEHRLPNTTLLTVPGIKGEAIVLEMDAVGVAISTGAACSSGSGEPSSVLTAMRLANPKIQGAIRFSVGVENTEEEMDQAANAFIQCVERLLTVAGQIENV